MKNKKEYNIVGYTKEEFLQIEKTTILRSEDSPTGYVVSFRLKAPEKNWLGVIGDWMFSDIHHSSHFTSGRYWPHEWQPGNFPHSLLGLKKTPEILLQKNSDKEVDPKQFEFDPEILKLGLYEMKKEVDTDLFICTIPLPSGVFNYRFVLEEPGEDVLNIKTIPDPNNLPQLMDGNERRYSQIMIPFDHEKQLEDRSIELPLEGEMCGKVIYAPYETDLSFALDKQTAGVYLPAQYDETREEAYPVLYLSHGGGGRHSDWFTQGALNNIMDHLIAEGTVEPMIVITMNNEVLHWKNKTACIPNIINYLIPYMEEQFHISKLPNRRSFAGFSAGGFLAFDMFSTYPANFGYFGIWSAGQRNEVDFTKPELKLPKVHLGAGRYDDAYYSFGYKLEDAFYEHGIRFTSYFPEGGHQWSVWRKLLEDFVKRVLWK